MKKLSSLFIITLTERFGSDTPSSIKVDEVSFNGGYLPILFTETEYDIVGVRTYMIPASLMCKQYWQLVSLINTRKERSMSNITNRDLLRMRLDVLNALRRERHIHVATPDLDNIDSWVDDCPEETLEQIVDHLERMLHIAPATRR